jgi:hypothetical protein
VKRCQVLFQINMRLEGATDEAHGTRAGTKAACRLLCRRDHARIGIEA